MAMTIPLPQLPTRRACDTPPGIHIAGLVRCSLVDWPGRVAAVVFSPRCNMDCFYCHNRALLERPQCEVLGIRSGRRRLNRRHVLTAILRRRHLIEGVVLSGGEPTLQPGLLPFIRSLKRQGLPVKLDTNGSNPRVLEHLLAERLIDAVAMDVKAPPHRYAEIAGTPIPVKRIERSLALLAAAPGLDYELRTTCVPQLSLQDLLVLGQWIGQVPRYVLQQYQPLPLARQWLDARHFLPPHPPAWFQEAARQLAAYLPRVLVRGLT